MLTIAECYCVPLTHIRYTVDKFVVKSCANIPGVKTSLYNTINVYDILNADKFIIAKSAVAMLEEVYA